MRIFFHPDCTVGTGITPDQRKNAFADFTAGGDSHPALKILFSSPTEYHAGEFLSRKVFCDKMISCIMLWGLWLWNFLQALWFPAF